MSKPTMIDYVNETPGVVRAQLAGDAGRKLAEEFLTGDYRSVRIVACGSSKNAATIARPWLRELLGLEVSVCEPYTFCRYEHELPADEFCFVVSQSGYSTNALAALACIRESGRLAIGVTGDVESDFREAADVIIDYGVGEEQVGYVTKGVTSLAVFLWLFGIDVARAQGRLDNAGRDEAIAGIEAVIHNFEAVRDQTPALLARRYKELSAMERVFLVGAGANYGVACEGALKYGECLQFPAMALELDEYLHGPNLQLSPDYTIFVVACGERDHSRAHQIVDATRLVTDRVFVLTDDPAATDADILVEPGMPELAAAISVLPFFQMTAYQLTEDEHLWHKHPLVASFDHALSGKSENYVDKEVL